MEKQYTWQAYGPRFICSFPIPDFYKTSQKRPRMIKEFELIYGSRPVGPRIQEMKTAQMLWAQDLVYFGGLTNDTTPELVLKEYVENGLGEPVYYRDSRYNVIRAAFPNSKYGRLTGYNGETVLGWPDLVVAVAQINAIQAGFFVDNPHDSLTGVMVQVNTLNSPSPSPTESPVE